jgi:porphobilinogen synthase
MRRLRQSDAVRRMVREVRLSPSDLISPLFVIEGEGRREPIDSMPGHARLSVDLLVEEVRRQQDCGVEAVLLFGVPSHKDAQASAAYAEDGIVQRAVRAIKASGSKVLVITDVCLCAYTDHGHCGVLAGDWVDNDPSLRLLTQQAVSHAKAGADIVAPSDMMDGRVGAIRTGLDEAGLERTLILSYAAKYASSFYGPFRDAADSAPQFGDRKSYQMDPSARRQARLEISLDVAEGADLIMVKPAMPYLDIIADARRDCHLPIVAYQVSGEFSMIEAAAARGWLDRKPTILESLTAIRRAGADLVITYWAAEVAGWIA